MYLFMKDQGDIIIINSETNVIRFLNDEEKLIVLNILPQLNECSTKSMALEDLPEGMKVMIHRETIQ